MDRRIKLSLVLLFCLVCLVECGFYKGHIRISPDGSVSSYMEGMLKITEPSGRVNVCASCHECACGSRDRYSPLCEGCGQCLSEFVYSCGVVQNPPSTSSCNCVNLCQNVTTHQTQTQSQNSTSSLDFNVTCISECTFSAGQGIHLDANCTGENSDNSTLCVQSFSANLSNCARKECGSSENDLAMVRSMAPAIMKGYTTRSHMRWLSHINQKKKDGA